MTHFAVAGLQLQLPNGENHERLEAAIGDVVKRFPWVQMILMSELAPLGWSAPPQALPGPVEDYYRNLARRFGVWLVPGSFYERHGTRNYNTATVIAPSGEVAGRYRKMLPFAPYEAGISPGNSFLVL